MEQIEAAAANATEMDQREVPTELGPQVECGPDEEACCVEVERPGSPSAVKGFSPDVSQPTTAETASTTSLKSLASASSEPSEKLDPELHHQRQQRPSVVSLAETDCFVCFNRYSASRLPKVLACQHAFCAVCLKLILRHEDQTWVISCPLCRKATVVFGGLICSLQNQGDILDRLESPGLDSEVPRLPDLPGLSHAARPLDSENQDLAGGENGRAAAKRLVLLLLLVMLLIVLVLPFVYTGLLKWALCFVVLLGLAMSVVLCCNPRWRCPELSLPPWRKKESQVASVA